MNSKMQSALILFAASSVIALAPSPYLLPRRAWLERLGTYGAIVTSPSTLFLPLSPASAAYLETPEFRGMDSGDENKDLPAFRTLSSGVKILDVVEGRGDTAEEGRSVTLQWVLRRQNGYFVDASSEHNFDPFIYRVGDLKRAIPGFDQGIRGMTGGGKRRFTIPSELAYKATGDNKPGPMPPGFGPRRQIETRKDRETWYFEVELTKVR